MEKTPLILYAELKDFVKENPGLWRKFAKETHDICLKRERIKSHSKGAQFPKISVRDWFGKARWDGYTAGLQADDNGFKLNNNHAAGFLRMYVAFCPQHRDEFAERGSKLDELPPEMFKSLVHEAKKLNEKQERYTG